MAKEWPVIKNLENGDVHLWSSYQEWNGGGTAGSFFVPELRMISPNNYGEIRVHCPRLPTDIRQWPSDLPYRDFMGDFYAGLNRLDSGIMRSALEVYQNFHPDTLRDHGFPETRQGLIRLANEIATVELRIDKLEVSLSELWLNWANPDNRCGER
jgi:hypothetical protein